MEAAPSEKNPGYQVGVFGAIAGMIVTFLIGIYIGAHPTWIPFVNSSSPDMPKSSPDQDHSTTRPATQP